MPRSKQFTTVTTLSKMVALALFVTLPFIGFFYGFNYAAKLCRIKYAGFTNPLSISENKNQVILDNLENNKKQLINKEAQNESYYLDAGGAGDEHYYSINIFPGWEVQLEQNFLDNKLIAENATITYTTNKIYKIVISQNGFSDAKCIYEDTEILTGNMDIIHSNFTDLIDANGNLYRRGTPVDKILVSEGINNYNVCQYKESDTVTDIAGYYLPTKNYELIRFETPTNPDEEILNQMDQMFESLLAREPETL